MCCASSCGRCLDRPRSRPGGNSLCSTRLSRPSIRTNRSELPRLLQCNAGLSRALSVCDSRGRQTRRLAAELKRIYAAPTVGAVRARRSRLNKLDDLVDPDHHRLALRPQRIECADIDEVVQSQPYLPSGAVICRVENTWRGPSLGERERTVLRTEMITPSSVFSS